jgi:hypothetical protein
LTSSTTARRGPAASPGAAASSNATARVDIARHVMSVLYSPFVVRAKPGNRAADFYNRGDRGLLHIHRLATARHHQPPGIAETFLAQRLPRWSATVAVAWRPSGTCPTIAAANNKIRARSASLRRPGHTRKQSSRCRRRRRNGGRNANTPHRSLHAGSGMDHRALGLALFRTALDQSRIAARATSAPAKQRGHARCFA